MVTYTDPATVRQLIVDRDAPRYGQTVSGYGGKIPTRYRVRFSDGHTRRVYVMRYGNAGSAYVVIAGQDHFLDTNTEHELYALANITR